MLNRGGCLEMASSLVPIALGLLHLSAAMPAITLQDLEVSDDTMSVGSYIREVRAAAPQDYYKSYENEGDGDIGYSRKKSGGGKKGYQHFDAYHKKAGDNYEFEKQDSYGQDKEDDDGAYSHNAEQRVKPRQSRSHKDEVETFEDPYERIKQKSTNKERDSKYYDPYERLHETVEEVKEEKRKQKVQEKPYEIDHEELRENSPDGNGGVEAYGHDPSDYLLPEKYTWESTEEEQ